MRDESMELFHIKIRGGFRGLLWVKLDMGVLIRMTILMKSLKFYY